MRQMLGTRSSLKPGPGCRYRSHSGINAIIGPYTLFCLYKAYSNIQARNFQDKP